MCHAVDVFRLIDIEETSFTDFLMDSEKIVENFLGHIDLRLRMEHHDTHQCMPLSIAFSSLIILRLGTKLRIFCGFHINQITDFAY